MEYRTAASVLMEITMAWDQGLQSFRASGQTRGGELHWEIGGHRHFPTFPVFQAALRNKGITLSSADANRLLQDQEASQAAADLAAARDATAA
ncbi:hypothetical protein [Nonomuraea sp. LPB2021202275-12-8]|uniref:hypothetical protein n=1 Tax=Nonomuraea sp. LPB2021202275-12-8 TaxID=3120159 RepID=UPI00300CD70F